MALLLVWGLSGCGKKSSSTQASPHLDGEKLLHEKCARCHNLDMPPKTSDHEPAPPIFAVVVHLKDWMKVENPSEKRAKFIAFVQDYVLHPSREKSYCDPKSLKLYGLMPSQQGKVTKEELGAIAAYLYDEYDQMKMLARMKEINRLKRLPPYEQVLETRDCRMCHIVGAGRLAPSFPEIAKRYGPKGAKQIRRSITEGSRGHWPKYHTPMRAYPDLTPAQLEGITQWILQQAEAGRAGKEK
ncbi:c-type cytochrome [Nitratifractor sp.]